MLPSTHCSSKSKPWSRSESGREPVLHPSSHHHRDLPEPRSCEVGGFWWPACCLPSLHPLGVPWSPNQKAPRGGQVGVSGSAFPLSRRGLRGFREARRDFWRGAESLEAALIHNAEVPRRRAQEAEEAGTALKAARAGYQGRALDYALQVPAPPTLGSQGLRPLEAGEAPVCSGRGRCVFKTDLRSFGASQINVIEDKRKFDIMEFVSCSGGEGGVERSLPMGAGGKRKRQKGPLSARPPARLVVQVLRLVEAQATHFQQGHEELDRLAHYRRELGAQVGTRRGGQGQAGGGGRGGGSEMPGLAWLRETGGRLKCPLLSGQLHQLVLNSARERRDMEQRHVLLKQKVRPREAVGPGARASACSSCPLTLLCPQELGGEEPEPSLKEGPGGLVLEGHLFKRASNAFKTWSR